MKQKALHSKNQSSSTLASATQSNQKHQRQESFSKRYSQQPITSQFINEESHNQTVYLQQQQRLLSAQNSYTNLQNNVKTQKQSKIRTDKQAQSRNPWDDLIQETISNHRIDVEKIASPAKLKNSIGRFNEKRQSLSNKVSNASGKQQNDSNFTSTYSTAACTGLINMNNKNFQSEYQTCNKQSQNKIIESQELDRPAFDYAKEDLKLKKAMIFNQRRLSSGSYFQKDLQQSQNTNQQDILSSSQNRSKQNMAHSNVKNYAAQSQPASPKKSTQIYQQIYDLRDVDQFSQNLQRNLNGINFNQNNSNFKERNNATIHKSESPENQYYFVNKKQKEQQSSIAKKNQKRSVDNIHKGQVNKSHVSQQSRDFGLDHESQYQLNGYRGGDYQKHRNLWQQLMDKTQENQIQKTRTNSSQRRTVENYLTGRTLNPSAFAPQADLLLVRDESLRSRKQKAAHENPNLLINERVHISGCQKKLFKNHQKQISQTDHITHDTSKKFSKQELSKFLTQNIGKRNNQEMSQMNSQLESGLIPNENQPVILGSSGQAQMHHEKCLNKLANRRQSAQTKNQHNYLTQIACLTPAHEQRNETNYDRSSSRLQRHLVSSLDSGLASPNYYQVTNYSSNTTRNIDKSQSTFQSERQRSGSGKKIINKLFLQSDQISQQNKNQSMDYFRRMNGHSEVLKHSKDLKESNQQENQNQGSDKFSSKFFNFLNGAGQQIQNRKSSRQKHSEIGLENQYLNQTQQISQNKQIRERSLSSTSSHFGDRTNNQNQSCSLTRYVNQGIINQQISQITFQ
eukprot:403372285